MSQKMYSTWASGHITFFGRLVCGRSCSGHQNRELCWSTDNLGIVDANVAMRRYILDRILVWHDRLVMVQVTLAALTVVPVTIHRLHTGGALEHFYGCLRGYFLEGSHWNSVRTYQESSWGKLNSVVSDVSLRKITNMVAAVEKRFSSLEDRCLECGMQLSVV